MHFLSAFSLSKNQNQNQKNPICNIISPKCQMLTILAINDLTSYFLKQMKLCGKETDDKFLTATRSHSNSQPYILISYTSHQGIIHSQSRAISPVTNYIPSDHQFLFFSQRYHSNNFLFYINKLLFFVVIFLISYNIL